MTAARQKVVRDLLEEGTRTALVLFACAAGIAGFLAVLSAKAILSREINRSYLATIPASATLWLDSVDSGLMAAVVAEPTIQIADARRIVTGQIRSGQASWHPLKLFVIPDFTAIRLGKLEPETGAWPPARGEILIERDALAILHTAEASLQVKTLRGNQHTVQMAGTVHDAGQAQARMEDIVYGYVSTESLADLGEGPELDRLAILVRTQPMDQNHIRTVAQQIAAIAKSRGHTVREIEVPVPGEHPHARIMGLLLTAVSSFGFCILLLSGVLVANLVTGQMASQGRQIGVMKAIGATTGQIASIYLSQSFLLGTAAILIALPVGIWGARQLSATLAMFLNIDLFRLAAPLWVYLLVCGTGWAVPLFAAALPVFLASRVPVRIGLISGQGSSRAFGSGIFDLALVKLSVPSRLLLLAFRNTFRHPSRMVLTLTVLVAGGTFYLTALNVRSSMIHTVAGHLTGRQRYAFDQHMLMVYVFLAVVSAIIGSIGGLGLMTAMSLNVLERRREVGVLRAIGASPSAICLIVVLEGVAAAILSWALAVFLSWPLSKLLGNFLWKRILPYSLDFRFEFSGLLIWLGVSVLLGIAASTVPAWKVLSTSVREALSHE